MRRKIQAALVGVGCLLLVLLMIGAAGYQATQQVPEFYEQALVVEPERQRQASDALLVQASNLASTSHREGSWEVTFTEDQINGWLAVDLKENHPKLLPREFSDPRIAISETQAQIGCRVEQNGFQTVFSLGLEVKLLEPNVVALRVRAARAGMVPLPLDKILERVSDGARKANLPIRWAQESGDPVAVITIPPQGEDKLERRIETIELRAGEIHIAGSTVPAGEGSTVSTELKTFEDRVARQSSAESENTQR